MIKNIVFDMGMVLLDYDPMMPCRRHAGNERDARQVCDAIFFVPQWGEMIDGGVLSEAEYFQQVLNRLDTSKLREIAMKVLEDWHLDALWPKEGMAAVLDDLLARKYKLYILSNAGHRFREFEYKIPHIDQFSGILVSAEEKMLKPNQEIYDRLCAKFGLQAEECLFVDDLQMNVDGAVGAGMQGYCFVDGDVGKLKMMLESL